MHEDKFHIPPGRDPGEFLNDAELAEYHARQLAEAPADDPRLPELRRAARHAAKSAAVTAEAIAEATEWVEAELALSKPKKPK